MAATAQIASQGSVQLTGPGRASLGGALRSEFTKIRSVRSTYWTLAAMVIITIGISALLSWGRIQDYASQPAFVQAHMAVEIRARATEFSMFGLILGQLVIAVLGALTITAEYSTGMIRTSLSVMPRRETVYVAKALVFTGVALVAAVRRVGGSVAATGDALVVHGLAPDRIGDLAYENGIRLHELALAHASLEEAFMELTAASVEFRAGGTAAEPPASTADRGDRVSTGGVA